MRCCLPWLLLLLLLMLLLLLLFLLVLLVKLLLELLLLLLLLLLHPTRDRCVRCAVQLPRQQHTHALHSGYSCSLKNRRRSITSPHRGYELPLEYRPPFHLKGCVGAPDWVRVCVAKDGLRGAGENS